MTTLDIHKKIRLEIVHEFNYSWMSKSRVSYLYSMEENQTSMQPDYKENISHLACIQDGVFVGLVGTKREKNGKQTKKKTCDYCAKCEIFL